jgi:hypothetical protein
MPARFLTMKAAAALCEQGGWDVAFAAELAEALGFGWEHEEYELRYAAEAIESGQQVPDRLLTAFRDATLTELAFVHCSMTPRHVKFLAEGLHAARRLRRLVIQFTTLGDYGVSLIAQAIKAEPMPLADIHLVGVDMGDNGAKAIAAAIASPVCTVEIWNLERNRITDEGGSALADACERALALEEPSSGDAPNPVQHHTATNHHTLVKPNSWLPSFRKLARFVIQRNYLSDTLLHRFKQVFHNSNRLMCEGQLPWPVPPLPLQKHLLLGMHTTADVVQFRDRYLEARAAGL